MSTCTYFFNLLQEWNAPKPMHPLLLNEALRWTIVSASFSFITRIVLQGILTFVYICTAI
jgi:hypothetical protein